MNDRPSDKEKNRFSARALRYASVGANVGGVAARIASRRLFGLDPARDKDAASLAAALGGLKGPIMKVAQLLATIPEALPAEYAAELGQLQSQAPPMGWPFVRRRMAAELGPDWQTKFASFEHEAAASASLGQVHRASSHDGRALAAKLQYPDMQSAVEADLAQLGVLFAIHAPHAAGDRHFGDADGDRGAAARGARLRSRGEPHALYALIFKDDPLRSACRKLVPELSTKRLLTMTWLDGRRLLDYRDRSRSRSAIRIARAMFRAWWYPFSHYGVIHGDPHLGNYTVFEDGEGRAAGINLLDYGCMRSFAPKFIQGVVDLYHGLLRNDRALIVHAYETWGFAGSIQRADRHPQYLGELHLRADARGPRAHHRRPGEPRHVWKTRGLQGASGLAGEGAGQGAARVRVHGPRGDRAGRGVPASRRRAQLSTGCSRTRSPAQTSPTWRSASASIHEAGVPLPEGAA